MADKRIKGITIEIDGNTKKLGEALQDVNKEIAKSNAELKDLKSALKLDPKNTELLAQKQEVLAKEIKATTDRLNTLKQAQKDMGEYNSLTDEQKENYRALSAEISRTESSLKNLNKEFKESSKFNLNNLNESLTGIRELSTDLVKKFAKVGTAITGALTALGVASIKSYADYEQLVGGVETLFKESADDIKKYAQNAYKTAGLSANEYMETVTSFSASLIQSLEGDTQKATKYADMAITDMSDNANKMGTSMESIQNAYQGFAKQNYTMLDNLKLGYGGTKTEMERLIKDANKVKEANGQMANLSIERFSDMVEAIHIIQNEMGITGTTAEEADKTILGSVNSMKASWKDLLVAVSDDNADMEGAVNNFIDSVITAGKNIVPRIRTAIDGIKKLFNSLVRDVFPKLKREIPELKPIINIFEWFIDHKALVMTAIKTIIGAFVVTKIVDFATKVKNAFDNIMAFASGGIVQKITLAVTAVVGVVTLLADAFKTETEEQRQARLEMEAHTDSLNDQISSWESLAEAQQKQINQGMTEISYYEDLYNELKAITDENGKVQEGYEARADFITSQLRDALGVEIQYTDGVISNYQEIQQEIDKVMEKKKAEVILDAQKSAYGEAKANEAEAIQNLIYWQGQLEEAENFLTQAIEKNNQQQIAIAKEKYKEIKDSYDKQEQVVNEYQYTIAQYEQNLVYAHEEAYDKIQTKSWEYVKDLENASDKEKAILEKDIETTKKILQMQEEAYERTGDEIYKTQIENSKRELQQQQENLNKYISAINDKQWEVTQAGANFMQGMANGISSKSSSVYSLIQSVGTTMLNRFKWSLKEQSPSKATREMGQFLLEGLSKGIKDDENALLNQVDELGNSVLGTLYADTQNAMNGLGGLMSTSLNPSINPSIAYDLNYKLMANAMKEALQEVDVELDDRKVGKFVNKVVSEEVFN